MRALTLVHSEPRQPTADRLIGWARALLILGALFVGGFMVAHRLLVHTSPADGCCTASKAP